MLQKSLCVVTLLVSITCGACCFTEQFSTVPWGHGVAPGDVQSCFFFFFFSSYADEGVFQSSPMLLEPPPLPRFFMLIPSGFLSVWALDGSSYRTCSPGDRDQPAHLISAAAALARFYPLLKFRCAEGLDINLDLLWNMAAMPKTLRECPYNCYHKFL